MVEGIDLGKRDMEKRIRAFAAALSGADVGLFFIPAMVCRSTSGTSSRRSTHSSNQIAVLREQIAKLQADQGALLKSQQEQLAALQNRLEAETKTAEPAEIGRASCRERVL